MGCGTSRQTNVDTFDYDTQLLNDVTRQFSVVVNPNDAHVGETPIRRHPEAVKGLATCVHPEEPQPVVTLWEAFQRGVRVNKNGPCFGMRAHKLNPDGNAYVMGADGFPLRGEYRYQTYAEVESEARAIGAGLASIGVQAGQHVGFYSKNRSEWMIGALGCWSQSMVIVALYDTLGAESTQYIINHSGLKVLFVSKDNLAMLLPSLPSVSLTHIIQFDVRSHINNIEETVDPAVVSDLASRGIKLMAFSELLNLGNASSTIFPNPAKSDDTAYTMYTSGTTGQPKGAMIGHQTLCSSIEASRQPMKLDHNDVHLSYLPLAHIFECGVMCAMICHGASVAFSTGIIKRLTEDIQGSRPTRFFGVPRVYQRIYTGLIAKIDAAGGVKAKWFHSVLRSESLKLRQGNFTPSFHAKFLMGKVRHAAGLDRVKSVITGAAPCPSYLLEFLRVLMQCDVIQGLGMTESCCVIAASDPHDHLLGHVGPPMICNEIKLVDVEEMGYLSTDKPHPRGEIWIRGNNVFKGYYNDPENNAAVLKPDGWLATGDVGRWNPNGTLSVIDRRKNLFKLSQGEYVAAEHIESLLSRSPVVGQIFVYGNSFKSFLIGVVVPNADFFQKHAMENGWWPADAHDVRTGDARWPAIFKQTMDQHLDEIREIILDSLRENSKQLKGFEIVKDWLIETDVDRDGFAFNTSNSLMTPTFKIRRPQLLQKYVGQFQQMYTRNGEADKPGEHWPGL